MNNNTKYPFKNIEKCVQNYWEKNKTFKTNNNTKKKKFYCLCMFPYPSGKLHIGHVRNYTIGDIISRFNRMLKKNVLFPIGWDCFGLPAENASIINNEDPKLWTYKNIKYMKKQIKMLGFSFDWEKEIYTCSKKYYKYEQYFIKKLFNKKIMYKKKSIVNWCKKDKTVLANEQVINNKCWRCNNIIEKKNKNQWFLKIENFSENLLNNLYKLKLWNNKVKIMQKKWIGKNKWYELVLPIYINNKKNNKYKILLYEENYFIKNIFNIKLIIINKNNILIKNIMNEYKYINNLYVYIPINNKKIHILIKNIYNFKKNIIINNDIKLINNYIKKNNIFNSNINFFNYYSFIITNNIKNKISNKKSKYIKNILYEKKILFYKKIFNIKDWCISRQRYWGSPIPIIYNKRNNKMKYINNKNIPLIIENKNKNYKNLLIEKDTFDTFIESSFYHIIFTYNKKYKKMVNNKITNYWLPIDCYIGGIEHATMHLIYIRYFNNLFYKFNLIKCKEPSTELICQGMVNSKSYYYIENKKKIWISPEDINKYKNYNLIYDGISKMSKSKNNGVDPIKIVKKYGADTLRTFIMFLAPIENDIEWDEKKIIGIYRFLNKIWKFSNFIKSIKLIKNTKILNNEENIFNIFFNNEIDIITNLMYKKKYNIIISKIMNLYNKINNLIKNNNISNLYFLKYIFIKLIKFLYPFSPHISFVIFKNLNIKKNIDFCRWPRKDNNIFKCRTNINNNSFLFINIMVNSKKKNIIKVNKNDNQNNIIKKIYNNKYINIKEYNVKKIIFIKNKMINFIIDDDKNK
ncbi:class I tRNA ligase family protein [Candidatus Nardonella dryophthoridicola]|uniref:leucine--tRNA ligase n=1 Tax=endosymbiont of Rhynchophorus ferrugineus TaxID=1972133 RepID=A0A2Z5TGT2_9GAMM|nr:class I tRNA ligase family protein [Candidatus Nardonella dryophthoridicola]BBA85043.1 leucine--tRNA ligase [endosymbiont of Rhynchophorus ferrugineus]